MEVIGNATLYHGDCRDMLHLLPAEAALISDPPYGIGFKHSGYAAPSGARRSYGLSPSKTDTIVGDDQPFDPSHLLGFPFVLLFGADHFRDRLPSGGQFICWDKSVGRGPADSFVDAEFAWCSSKVKRNVFRYLWKGLAQAGEKGVPKWHVSQKPVALMQWCIAHAPPQLPIIDPYMGSGSTGVACPQDRRFYGCEIEARHFDTACRRIEDSQRQGRLLA